MRRWIVAAVVVVLVGVLVVAVLLASGDDGEELAAGTTTTTAAGPEPGATTRPTTTVAPPTTAASTTTPPPTTAPSATTSTTRPLTTVTSGTDGTGDGGGSNRAPSVSITSPGSGQRFEAFYNAATGRFVAVVGLSASVSDPDGDSYTVEWFSSDDGFLGSGQSISAALSPVLDTGQPTITARVTDAGGAVSQASVSVIVWIRSDE